jgi:septum formation protein
MPDTLILASRSPRRENLLRLMGVPFRVELADVDESPLEGESPEEMVRRLAAEKARAVAVRNAAATVIGADTIVVLNDTILGKPTGDDQARQMLTALSAHTHDVYTGVAVYRAHPELITGFVEKTRVTFGPLTDDDISEYIATGSPFDKAGGYGIQDDRGALFVEHIKGDFYNVMGLPVYRLNRLLRSEFPNLFHQTSS